MAPIEATNGVGGCSSSSQECVSFAWEVLSSELAAPAPSLLRASLLLGLLQAPLVAGTAAATSSPGPCSAEYLACCVAAFHRAHLAELDVKCKALEAHVREARCGDAGL